MPKHSKFPPSAASRWSRCTASFYAHQQEETEAGPSIYAREGTICHEIAAKVLKDEAPLASFLGYSEYWGQQPIIITEEHIDAIQEYIDILYHYQAENKDSDLQVEQSVTIADESWGTSDAILRCSNHLHIFDLKMGRGEKVEAEDNEQLLMYGYGSLQEYTPLVDDIPHSVTMHIVQPRIPSGDPHTMWTLTTNDLIQIVERELLPAIEVINQGPQNTEFTPGEKQCRWCNHSPDCKALAEYNLAIAQVEFGKFAKQEVGEQLGLVGDKKPLTLDEKRQLLDAFPLFEMWMKAIREDMYKQALDLARKGEKIPGYKIVASSKHRKWKDEKEAYELLSTHGFQEDELYTKKLISPSQAEKKIPKEDREELAKLIIKPQGDPVLVQDSDKRPALPMSAEEEFKDYKQN